MTKAMLMVKFFYEVFRLFMRLIMTKNDKASAPVFLLLATTLKTRKL